MRVLTFLLTCFALLQLVAEPSRPNVIVILCDDLGYGDVEGFGTKVHSAQTPALKKMAEEGAKLTHFLVTAPFCSPSRSSILTGRYPFRTSVMYNPAPDYGIDEGMPQSEYTLGEMFKENHYDTYYVGKWHLGHLRKYLPTHQGFDEYFGILYSNDMRPVQIVHNEKVAEYPVIQSLLTKKYTDRSIDYIKESVKRKNPFFLMLSHAMPHRPLAASDQFYTPETPDDLYEDVMRELDYNIGRIFECLKQQQIDNDTLVVFLSDNGANNGGSTGGLRGKKGNTFDGGLRVPFIARWPGVIPAGVENEAMASAMDLMPTFSKMIGHPLHADLVIDGLDLMPLLKDAKARSQHEFLVGMKRDKIQSIHTAKWKLHVENPGFYSEPKQANTESRTNRWPDGSTIIAPMEQPTLFQYPGLKTGDRGKLPMLFDMRGDIGEQKNLSKSYPEEVKKLLSYYKRISKEMPNTSIPSSKDFVRNLGGKLEYWKE